MDTKRRKQGGNPAHAGFHKAEDGPAVRQSGSKQPRRKKAVDRNQKSNYRPRHPVSQGNGSVPVITLTGDGSTLLNIIGVLRRLAENPDGLVKKESKAGVAANSSVKGGAKVKGRANLSVKVGENGGGAGRVAVEPAGSAATGPARNVGEGNEGAPRRGIASEGEVGGADYGRWPLDMLQASGGGIMALKVQDGAGLDRYGISDRDVLLVGFDDPKTGDPAMVAIDGKIAIGWYRRKGRRVVIEPLTGEGRAVVTEPRRIQVACGLKGLVRQLSGPPKGA